VSTVIVSLNTAQRDELFAPIRAIEGVELVHAEYRTSWEEVAARRAGRPAVEPEVLSPALRGALQRANVVFGFIVPRDLPALAPRLRWLATPTTGIDHLRGSGVFEAGIPVTSAAGLFGDVLAEHVFAGILYFVKRLAHFEGQRRSRTWQMSRLGGLGGKTIGLLGVGSIGTAVAIRAKAFGMHTIGLGRSDPNGRTVPGVDRLVSRAALPELLAASDFVVVAVADTLETRGMLGRAELDRLRPEAVLVNVARGSVVDEEALVAALRDGRLAGAALDVFAQEPLPPENPLWELPNVLVTPHVATNVPEYLARAVASFAEDVRRFAAGARLARVVDPTRGY